MMERNTKNLEPPSVSMMYSETLLTNSLMDKLKNTWQPPQITKNKVSADSLMERLFLLEK